MGRFHIRRPSAGMAVAFVALIAALSGTAVALPGKNTVDSGDIKNNKVKSSDIRDDSIRSKDIKSGEIRTSDLKNGDVRGQDLRTDTVKGADVDEGSLGKVPSAANADNAATANFATSAGTAGPLAFALVNGADGTVSGNPTLAKNIGDANITMAAGTDGSYCFDLAFTPRNVLVTNEVSSGASVNDKIVSAVLGQSSGGLVYCPAGTEVEVRVIDASSATPEDSDFYIQLN